MADVEQKDIEVAREDQERINKFSRLNMKYDELDEEITTMKTEVQNFKAGIAKLPSGSCRTLMFVKVFEDTFQSVAKSWQTWNLSLLVWLFD